MVAPAVLRAQRAVGWILEDQAQRRDVKVNVLEVKQEIKTHHAVDSQSR